MMGLHIILSESFTNYDAELIAGYDYKLSITELRVCNV